LLLLPCTTIFFTAPPTTELYTLSLHDALPISAPASRRCAHRAWPSRSPPSPPATGPAFPATTPRATAPDPPAPPPHRPPAVRWRSEEHTSELQSRENLVCRLLLEKKKHKQRHN